MTDQQCTATRKDGERCVGRDNGSGFCNFHDPAKARDPREAGRIGGKARSNQARAAKRMVAGAKTPEQLSGVVGTAIDDVNVGAITPNVANSIANLTRAAVSIWEKSKLEQDIAEIKDKLGIKEV
jgi:hypothetical protein